MSFRNTPNYTEIDLGNFTDTTNITKQGSVLEKFSDVYLFEVENGSKLYPQFDLYDFDDVEKYVNISVYVRHV